MFFDFLNILALLTIFSGVICLVDILWRKYLKKSDERASLKAPLKHPLIIDYARSFFPILLIVLIIRSLLFQPYRVPTGSLEPTVLPGDLILVSQYDYGLHFPLWNTLSIKTGHPKTGEIALFHWPVNPAATFVKRVIGIPGDHISYINKVLFVNSKKMTQTYIKDSLEIGDDGSSAKVEEYEEDLSGVKHRIFIRPDRSSSDFKDLIVPQGQYFMMGDNRDNSDDSRFWGFVKANELIGRGRLIWMSWDSENHRIRWRRIGEHL